jgi:hypothetical protein
VRPGARPANLIYRHRIADARQVRAPLELNGKTGRGGQFSNCRSHSDPVIPHGFLVRERDDDEEGNHNKGDRLSIKPFPIEVDTHRTALLFAEAANK